MLVLDSKENSGTFAFIDNIYFFDNKIESTCQLEPHPITFIENYYRTEQKKLYWLQSELEKNNPDKIVGFGYDLLGYFGLLNTRTPRILDVVDSEMLYLWRNIKEDGLSYKIIKHLVASVLLSKKNIIRCNTIITVSEEDSKNIYSIINKKRIIHTISNGVDNSFFCPDSQIKKIPGKIVFSGSLSWPPNQQAIKWFVSNCWHQILKNQPNASLSIIGKSPPSELKAYLTSYPRVHFLGFVDDIRDHIRSSQVSIAPMVSGSGIKNKILEAWAMGIPVVSTSLGSSGLICIPDENILVADSPISFAEKIMQLMDNNILREQIAEAGRQNVIKNYSWDKITKQFNKLLNN
jgi:glycosyltransferase involved in cell wall biosynthesis